MHDDASLKAWLALSWIRGLCSRDARQLLAAFGSPEAIFEAASASLQPYVKRPVIDSIQAGIDEEKITPVLKWLSEDHNHVVTLADDSYPKSLLNTPDPPILLYVKGKLSLLNRDSVSIVGSRNATPQGMSNAHAFAESLSQSGLCIISGLALGIDAAAHQGGLKGQGSSLAVVGTGLDKVYPAANRDLAHTLAREGTLVSEFPLGTPPLATNFPRRNRIISGLSLGCLVVEASMQSGSLITALLALEQGREVFAIPGSIHSPQSKGCHALIKQGAKLVETAHDVLEELGKTFTTDSSFHAPTSTEGSSLLLDHLGCDPTDIDTLSNSSGLTVSELSAMLLVLELEGSVATLPGGFYQRI